MSDIEFRTFCTFFFVLLFLSCYFYYAFVRSPKVLAASTGTQSISTPKAPNYGVLAPIARPLEWTVRQVQSKLTYRLGRSSWGWAIIATTLLLNLLLLPFRIFAARNAQAVRRLQPKIDAVNAKYKDRKSSPLQMDPNQSAELSAIYREAHVHPLSSCFPAIAPFFVLGGFYSVIRNLPNFRGAHWLWISDLSRPEDLPVRLLPLLMIGTQLLLSKLTPAISKDQNMNRLTMFMPLILGYMFYGQPAALLLYWLTGNILAVATQYWLNKKYA